MSGWTSHKQEPQLIVLNETAGDLGDGIRIAGNPEDRPWCLESKSTHEVPLAPVDPATI